MHEIFVPQNSSPASVWMLQHKVWKEEPRRSSGAHPLPLLWAVCPCLSWRIHLSELWRRCRGLLSVHIELINLFFSLWLCHFYVICWLWWLGTWSVLRWMRDQMTRRSCCTSWDAEGKLVCACGSFRKWKRWFLIKVLSWTGLKNDVARNVLPLQRNTLVTSLNFSSSRHDSV